jgi:hypothetical protein
MREFALMIQPTKDVPFQLEKYSFDALKNFPGGSRLWKDDVATDGELCIVREDSHFREFDITLRYKRRQTQISSDRPEVTGKFKIWQHKGGLLMAIDSDRKISEVAAAFLSIVQYNDLRAIRLLRINTGRFLALKNYTMKVDGKVTMLHLRDGIDEDGSFTTYHRHGSFDFSRVDSRLGTAKRIKRIGFSFSTFGESYNFWIADWGVGAIYRPTEMLPHQVAGLLEFFEGALLRANSIPK